MNLSRHVDDERRTSEIQKQSGVMKTFEAIPSVKQVRNNQIIFVTGTGFVIRVGDSLYDSTGTLVS